MRILLITLLHLICFNALPQSKKEQIEILNYRIDSLNKVMDVENNKFIINKTQFETQISNIRDQIMLLDSNLVKLKQELSNKQNELYSSKISIGDKSMEIKLLEKNILEKEESINLLNSEIENLKSSLALQNPTEISNEVSPLNDNKIVEIKTEVWEKTDNYELLRLLGPEGCDATSLYKDSKGTLWLGTGSSGGVYKYDNLNKVWIETNNGIGPVHVTYILEIDNILVMEFDNGAVNDNSESNNREYRYFQGDEWLKVEANQIDLIQSQIKNRNEEKNNRLIEYEAKYHDKLLSINLDYKFLHSIELIDNVLYLLDKRGLFYIQSSDNSIRKFNSKGLNASDVYQILPDEREKLFVWTNSYQLWELSKEGWKMLGDLKYDFSLSDNTPTFKTILDEEMYDNSRRSGFYSDELNYENSSFMSNGYLTYSKEKFLLSILGKLYELDFNKKVFNEILSVSSAELDGFKNSWSNEDKKKAKIEINKVNESLNFLGDKKQEFIDCYLDKIESKYQNFIAANNDQKGCYNLANECMQDVKSGEYKGKKNKDNIYFVEGEYSSNLFIKEALYDIDGSLVFTIGSSSENFDYPIRKISSKYTPFKEVQLKNHPSIVLNNEGRVYGYKNEFIGTKEKTTENNYIPLSLSMGDSKNFIVNESFEVGLFNSKDNSDNLLNNRFLKKSLAQNKVQVSGIDEWGCGGGEYIIHEYYVIEPLKSVNTRFTCFYDDKNGNMYIGTAGSGLLKVQY